METLSERATLNKVAWRLIPFMFVLYIVAYLDRINVSFAALQMNRDLGFSTAMYGLGASLFFVGYFFFELPSNLILDRIGARVWIARIMISWGVISSAMMFVKGSASFYLLRFALGVAEAGFFPGMILYLTYWFPARERARAVALFMTATAISGVIGAPLSGALLSMDGLVGLKGWQWLFLVEGIPAVALGFVVWAYLTDRPEQAGWLEPQERTWLISQLQLEREAKERAGHYKLLHALSNPWVWLFSLLYFSLIMGLYGMSLWIPQFIKDALARSAASSKPTDLVVCLLSAPVFLAASVGMVLIGRHSDRTGERRWHVAMSALLGALGAAASAFIHEPFVLVASLSLSAIGIWGALGPFWALPTSFLAGTAAAGGIAIINSIGNLAGFVSANTIGKTADARGSFTVGLLVVASSLAIGAILALCAPHSRAFERIGIDEKHSAAKPQPN